MRASFSIGAVIAIMLPGIASAAEITYSVAFEGQSDFPSPSPQIDLPRFDDFGGQRTLTQAVWQFNYGYTGVANIGYSGEDGPLDDTDYDITQVPLKVSLRAEPTPYSEFWSGTAENAVIDLAPIQDGGQLVAPFALSSVSDEISFTLPLASLVGTGSYPVFMFVFNSYEALPSGMFVSSSPDGRYSGEYSVTYTYTPEPSSILMLACGSTCLRRKKRPCRMRLPSSRVTERTPTR